MAESVQATVLLKDGLMAMILIIFANTGVGKL
jgi:hypothetical protein